MEIPGYQPFYIASADELRSEIARLGLQIPTDDNLGGLAQSLAVGRATIPNRFCAQPIAGRDAAADGSPGPLTSRRYRRYAEGRFGLLWVESTTVGPAPEKAGQLCLNETTLGGFRAMVSEVRASASESPVIVLQLASDRSEELLRAAKLAAEAGFDGVDLQCPRDALPDLVSALKSTAPDLVLTVRLFTYAARRGGFGVSANDFRKPDLTEPIRLVQRLQENGLALLNVTAASPTLHGPDRGVRGRYDSESPNEHPLMTLARQLELAKLLRVSTPGLAVVGSGFSWLRQFVPTVASGALGSGMIDIVGLGRGALAYPGAPADVFHKGRMEAGSACMVCFACGKMRDEGEAVGCVLRDPAVYAPVYQQMRRFDGDVLAAGAKRCHLCEAAPCVAASPTRTNIPAFIEAFRAGDEARAFEIIRASDLLPELTSQTAPAWLESEGACIETALTGTSVPILDLQYAIAWRARDQGRTGVRVPEAASGKRVAIVGGGPAGISAAARLVELGHTVHLFERSHRLGGVPARLSIVRGTRSPGDEIDALLRPALAADRLRLHFGATLAENVRLHDLRADHDAVLIAAGLWQERSIGSAKGVTGALAFLESPESPVPPRVAVLAGGDAAMDSARLLQQRGAKEIYVIFGGPRSAMHWHIPESWFATPGVHAMMCWQPLGYELDSNGHVCGIRLRQTELGSKSVLAVGLVVEAMELQSSAGIQKILSVGGSRIRAAGAVANGGASVGHCVSDGLAAAIAIHHELSS